MDESLSGTDLETCLSRLSPAAEGLYYFLPDHCSMTEKTMAQALQVSNRVIRKAKQELAAAGLITIIREPNKPHRPNQRHRIIKVIPGGLHPIPPAFGWVVRAREHVLSPFTRQPEGRPAMLQDGPPVMLNWELLKQHSPAELNRLPKLEQVELYIEVGFLVLPTHYPRFGPTGAVTCSCNDESCRWPGKHPYVKSYKTLTPATYRQRRKWYLQRFKREPDLNIGFKVFGYSVLDVDYRSGGAYSLEALCESWPGLDETLSVTSPNGQHLYSSTTGLSQSAGMLGAGLDIRSDGTSGFIVAPCSTHRSGKLYQWHLITDPQPMPEQWLEQCQLSETSAGKQADVSISGVKIPDQVYPGYLIPEHSRNSSLFKWASRARGRGAGAADIYQLLVRLRDKYCEKSKNPQEDVTDAELWRIAKSACRYPTNAQKLSLSKAA